MQYQSGGLIAEALRSTRDAYLYTGDERYGRVCAIMTDRIADVYPAMDTGAYFPEFYNSDSTQPAGKIAGSIWAYWEADVFAKCYNEFTKQRDGGAELVTGGTESIGRSDRPSSV